MKKLKAISSVCLVLSLLFATPASAAKLPCLEQVSLEFAKTGLPTILFVLTSGWTKTADSVLQDIKREYGTNLTNMGEVGFENDIVEHFQIKVGGLSQTELEMTSGIFGLDPATATEADLRNAISDLGGKEIGESGYYKLNAKAFDPCDDLPPGTGATTKAVHLSSPPTLAISKIPWDMLPLAALVVVPIGLIVMVISVGNKRKLRPI